MSRPKTNDKLQKDFPSVLVISDSDDSSDELIGFSTPQKRFFGDPETPIRRDATLAKKKLKIDTEPNEEPTIDIDSVSTNPMRPRTKVSSDTSSKFPVSSPSDTVPQAGHRKKYVKNTLPAGAEWRMLQEIAMGYPPITYREKLNHWYCCDELSDVEDVNNFDDQFQQREKFYTKTMYAKRGPGKDIMPYPNYNYQHFRAVILETLRGSPVSFSQESGRKSSHLQPSCSRDAPINSGPSHHAIRPDSSSVSIYEKILCPSSESSATKASPSIRLHWTDDESVFRCNRLNPDIDKYSQLIKVRIDYNKQIDLKAKINEIFKTPSVPIKYNSPPKDMMAASGIESKSMELLVQPAQEMVEKKIIHLRRSIESQKSSDRRSSERRSSERRSSDRRSSEKFPEMNCFQQDEFCNYLGLGMNGKVYSPTPTDNKRRSLRVKRLQVQNESADKKKTEKKKEIKKKKNNSIDHEDDMDKDDKDNNEKPQQEEIEEPLEVSATNVNEIRCPTPLSFPIKQEIDVQEPVAPKSPETLPPMDTISKTPEIKIITQLRSTAATTKSGNTPSSVTTANSTPPPTTRRQRRTRATSNGTSTCPRSSQSDESPEKSLAPRGRTRGRRLNHLSQPDDHASDFLSESIQSDPPPIITAAIVSPKLNGRTSTIPSSDDKKDEPKVELDTDDVRNKDDDEVHKKYQRYLEESRKTKPSIFIVDSINNTKFKTTSSSPSLNNFKISNSSVIPKEHTSKERKKPKNIEWPGNKIVLRRLLRRNGTIIGTFNQRILRNRTVTKSSKALITKHHNVKSMKKKMLRMHLGKTKVKKGESKNNNQRDVTKIHQASQIDIDSEKEMTSLSIQVDPLALDIKEEEELPEIKLVETYDADVQTDAYVPPMPINFLSTPSDRMPNPLTPENGRVIYAYYELDILTIVQDFMVTFWKTCRLTQVVANEVEEWVLLGECKRLLFDTEIEAPYKNRICVHNSIPIYMEIRAKELPPLNRDCVLISVYVNVYYYHDEDLIAKSHSIQLDTVASQPKNVVYTTITDSRYFVMCWSQETPIGKTLSGLCKYSLTPHLDTLASIREFKSMRHEIRYLECTMDDNLIGFGDSQVTLWDHRSGDILMNYDLDMKIGNNVGSLHFPPLEVGQPKTVLILQKTGSQELSIIAINVSHNAPSHQLVCKHILPPEFDNLKSTMDIEDYTILTNTEHQELWIDHSDPQYMVQIKTPEGQRRFYSRCKQNVIVITENHLALETFSSFVLKMSNITDI